MSDWLVLVLCGASFGQIGLVISQLLMQRRDNPAASPLILLLVSVAVLIALPVVRQMSINLTPYALALMLPALYLTAPLLWFYTRALTAIERWQLGVHERKHLVIPAITLAVTLFVMLVPHATLMALLTNTRQAYTSYVEALMLVVFLLVVCWIPYSLFYMRRIMTLTAQYRRVLKQHFANLKSRSLYWVTAYSAVLGGVWLLFAAHLFIENTINLTLLSPSFIALLVLTLVWGLSWAGVRQRPAFLPAKQPERTAAEAHSVKYQRSALTHDQANRIAEKLTAHMQQHQSYLDPDITLGKLAEGLQVSPNYLSQTLNDTLGMSFFDYINHWRIKDARKRLEMTEDSILEIAYAVGFNARSSFYKAFKMETGQTPAAYRKHGKNTQVST